MKKVGLELGKEYRDTFNDNVDEMNNHLNDVKALRVNINGHEYPSLSERILDIESKLIKAGYHLPTKED